jgi:hypothetical protein
MRPSRYTRTLEALSQLINVVLFDGDSDEMLSSRAYREHWTRVEWFLDSILGKGHCREAFEWEREHYKCQS